MNFYVPISIIVSRIYLNRSNSFAKAKTNCNDVCFNTNDHSFPRNIFTCRNERANQTLIRDENTDLYKLNFNRFYISKNPREILRFRIGYVEKKNRITGDLAYVRLKLCMSNK